jgi:sulfite reductase (ferredoxin)
MCLNCGCDRAPTKLEGVKAGSGGLRGTIAEELAQDTDTFSGDNANLLKFHGVYQQEDRDRRREARQKGLDRHYQMMIRTRIPGGRVSPDGYLAHDDIAQRWGNGTLRVTTRQNFQLHGVVKGDLWSSLHAINQALMTTLGGCGDQVRNVMCCPAPFHDPLRDELAAALPDLVAGLTPTTHAYHEIWVDGEPVPLGPGAGPPPDPSPDSLYLTRYLPRKFKVAIAVEGDNCVDVYSNDLGFVAMRRRGQRGNARNGRSRLGGLAGFNVLVGGGLGRTNNKPETYPAVAQPLGFVEPRHLVETARAVVAVQRDYGDRSDRRHARLKYLLADRGLDWFRGVVQSRLSFQLAEPWPMRWEPLDDHLGWHYQGDGRLFYGQFVENGRIVDSELSGRLRTALRVLVADLRPVLWMTPQQNLLITDIEPGLQAEVEGVLRDHRVPLSSQISNTLRSSMACPAIPTCGLAVAEAERALPSLIREIEGVVDELGLAGERISFRMTGCPNGCARPYLGDVGLVGTTLGKYDVFLGGDYVGTRLNALFATNVPLAEIPSLLERPLSAFARERAAGEGFGDWCHRLGTETLRERFMAAPAVPS